MAKVVVVIFSHLFIVEFRFRKYSRSSQLYLNSCSQFRLLFFYSSNFLNILLCSSQSACSIIANAVICLAWSIYPCTFLLLAKAYERLFPSPLVYNAQWVLIIYWVIFLGVYIYSYISWGSIPDNIIFTSAALYGSIWHGFLLKM